MFINLRIFSKNHNSLKNFLKFFIEFSTSKHLLFFCKSFKIRKNKKKFSVLKSPHVNKKAQEQFEFCTFSKEILICSPHLLKVLVLIKRIKGELFPEIKMKVKFLLNSKNKKKMTLKSLKFENYLSNRNRLEFKTVEKYLSVLDVFGELNLMHLKK